MAETLADLVVHNARIIDSTGGDAFEGSLFVKGDEIAAVERGPLNGNASARATRDIDARGGTVMPGMCDGHWHPSYYDIIDLTKLDLAPIEESVIHGVKHCQLMLECGFTMAVCAGAHYRIDAVLRDSINNGEIPGPRVLAAGRDICPTAGLTDWNPDFWKLGLDGLTMVCDGEEEIRKAVRKNIKQGADVIKLFVSGEGAIASCNQYACTVTKRELEVFAEEVHRRDKFASTHVRDRHGARMCAEVGVDIINHATFADDETLAIIRDKNLFIVPALGYIFGVFENGDKFGLDDEFRRNTDAAADRDHGCEVIRKAHQMGIRVVTGGDYGFAWVPHGSYAWDLELFVKHMGFSEMEAIVAATKHGAELLRMGGRVGTLEPGKLADFLVVDGDPLADISILRDRSRLRHVFKDGKAVAERGRPACHCEKVPA